MANIKNNNYRKFDCRLINDIYMDFMISKDNINEQHIDDLHIAANLNFKNIQNRHIVSDTIWEDATSSNTILKNIGYTGVDNGFIQIKKNNDNINDILKNSSFDLSTFNKYFFVTEVSGNTGEILYPIESNEDYVSLKGGFYQGFFKIYDDEYQTLPHKINSEWNFNFQLRRKDYEINENTLNILNENNAGIFFYIGTRSENKFSYLYNNKEKNNNVSLTDSNDNPIDKTGFYEIETDNKHIIFNNTKNGYNIYNWNEDIQFILTGKTESNMNYFPYLNRTKTGYTKDNIYLLNEEQENDYNVLSDINSNAFALKINNNGSISYRYYCNNEIVEETSHPNLIKLDEWVNITLKIVRLPNSNTDCENELDNTKMKLYIYINGKLKLVSKELPLLKLKNLKDSPERQEYVPYTISIGGGSQGLKECILPNFNKEEILPIERYFSGTFIGDLKSFNFIPHSLNYNLINKHQ